MKKILIFTILILLLLVPREAFAGILTMDHDLYQKATYPNVQTGMNEEIPVLDAVDKVIIKRRSEAHKLIEEGNKLIKKGEKKNNQQLVMKGQIKKEIGTKQLALLKEQAENKKLQEQNDGW